MCLAHRIFVIVFVVIAGLTIVNFAWSSIITEPP